jgi:hypothetical protein
VLWTYEVQVLLSAEMRHSHGVILPGRPRPFQDNGSMDGISCPSELAYGHLSNTTRYNTVKGQDGEGDLESDHWK